MKLMSPVSAFAMLFTGWVIAIPLVFPIPIMAVITVLYLAKARQRQRLEKQLARDRFEMNRWVFQNDPELVRARRILEAGR